MDGTCGGIGTQRRGVQPGQCRNALLNFSRFDSGQTLGHFLRSERMRRAICDKCKKLKMVNLATRREKSLGEFCGDCWDSIKKDEPPRNRSAGCSGGNHNNPGFDNVIRALEEDR